MSRARIVYQDWIAQLGYDPGSPELWDFNNSNQDDNDNSINEAVRAALDRLDEEEKEFITRFYFMGEPYGEIAASSGRKPSRLEAMHKRAVKKLRKHLAEFVKDRFGIKKRDKIDCPICNSKYRAVIDKLIAGRDKTKTWKVVMDRINDEYGLKFRSPQLLIGHEKYHS